MTSLNCTNDVIYNVNRQPSIIYHSEMAKRRYTLKEATNLILQDSESETDFYCDSLDTVSDIGTDETSTEAELGELHALIKRF